MGVPGRKTARDIAEQQTVDELGESRSTTYRRDGDRQRTKPSTDIARTRVECRIKARPPPCGLLRRTRSATPPCASQCRLARLPRPVAALGRSR